jgi:nicotinamidase-related amidase
MKPKFKILLLIGLFIINPIIVFPQDAGFPNNKFLIVLDVQRCWTENSLTEEAAEQMLFSINALIDRTDPARVIYVTSPALVSVLTLKGVRTDTIPGKELDKKLKVVNNTIFMKTEGDAFSAQELISYLEKNNAKEIIISGLLAEKCVTHTAIGGMERDYTIFIYPETIGAKSEKSKVKTIKKLKKSGVKILENSPAT